MSASQVLICLAKRSVWRMAAVVQITSGIKPARGEENLKNKRIIPDTIITVDQIMSALAPYLLIAYQLVLDVNAFVIRKP